jgi:CO/xanthine dehydrogenase Mo-binding subunit
MTTYQYLDKPARRVDGKDKVTGKARYVGDFQLAGMLHTAVLRSPLPHALIKHLDVSPALAVPGVKAVITAQDFVDNGNFGWPVKDAYVLAYQKVRYVGDAIAAVAGESEAAVWAGIKAIRLELEELGFVSDLTAALDPEAPLVPLVPPLDRGNLVNTHLVRNGEPDPILSECAHVFEQTYMFAHQEHAYLETEGALAIPKPDGGLTIYSNDQSPFITRDNLVMLLGMPAEKLRVIQPAVGGSFGGKDDVNYQNTAIVGKLALITNLPVRLLYTREESFLASYKREAMQIKLKLGADKAGILQAAKSEVLADSGAYASMTPLSSWRATVHAVGAYRYKAVHVDTQSVYTNNGYSGAFRGFGNTEAVAAIEQAVDEFAEQFGQDPIEFRLKNIVRERGEMLMTGNKLDQEVSLEQCLQWVRERSGWDRKRAQYASQTGDIRRGIGVACYMHGSSLGGEGADYATTTLRIEADNTIMVTSGLTDYGQGSRTVFALITAETLGVDYERVRISNTDTSTGVESGPTVASRSTMLGGNAAKVASMNLLQIMNFAAADMFKCLPSQIIRQGELFIGPNEEPASFDAVVQHARDVGLSLYVEGKWEMPKFDWNFEKGKGTPYMCYTFGAQVVEVETDLITGETKAIGIWAAHDGGTIVFKQGADGQFYGGIGQGLGYGMLEEMKYDKGYPTSLNYDQYLIPTALDMPEMEIRFIQVPYYLGPYGAKNMAEPVMIATGPALANALAQATGTRHHILPLTPERLATGLEFQRKASLESCRNALGFSTP